MTIDNRVAGCEVKSALRISRASGACVLLVSTLILAWPRVVAYVDDSAQCVPSFTGLVGWWSGDGHANDLSGLGNHGRLVGSGVTFAPGIVDLAFSFNNTDGMVEVPHAASLMASSEVSVEAWIRPAPISGESFPTIVNKFGWPGGGGWLMGLQTIYYADATSLGWGVSREPASPVGYDTAYSGMFATQQWQHFVGVYAQAQINEFYDKELRLYMNGARIFGRAATGDINSNTQPVRIGLTPFGLGGSNRPFDGLIDEVRVYNRALTDAEIAAIYQAGGAGMCKTIAVHMTVKSGPLNCNAAKLEIPVAILTTRTAMGDAEDFDATTVDPRSVRFGRTGTEALESHDRGHLEDVDGDGDLDMVLHFRFSATGLSCGNATVRLTGRTTDNRLFQATGTVKTVR